MTRAGRVLLAVAALALLGCEPITGGGCHDADIPAVVPIDLSGTWTGMVRDAVSMRFELRQAHALTEPERQVGLTGTVSITIPGPVAASDSVSGWTLADPQLRREQDPPPERQGLRRADRGAGRPPRV